MDLKEKIITNESKLKKQYNITNNYYINGIKKLSFDGDIVNFTKKAETYFNSAEIRELKKNGVKTSDILIEEYSRQNKVLHYTAKTNLVINHLYNSMEKCALSNNFNQQIGMQIGYDSSLGENFVVLTTKFNMSKKYKDQWIFRDSIFLYYMQDEKNNVELPGDLSNKCNSLLASTFEIGKNIDVLLFEYVNVDKYKYLGEFFVKSVDYQNKFFILQNKNIKNNIVISQIKKHLLDEKYVQTYSKTRIGQFFFREQLIEIFHGKCALCRLEGKELLLASHIKPYSLSDCNECIDPNNGLLLCPNHDKLFDKGLISFDSNGDLLISSYLTEEQKAMLNINNKQKIFLNEKMKEYMQYHKLNVFKSNT